MEDNPLIMIRFEGASDTRYNPDGTTEEEDLTKKLRGNFVRNIVPSNSIIRVNDALTDQQAALTIFHEYQHYRGFNETDTRVRTEKFAISMGWPATRKNYRTADGKPNIAFIRKRIARSPHYNSRDKRPKTRRYIGETIVTQ